MRAVERWGGKGNGRMGESVTQHLQLEDSEVEGQVFLFSPRDQNIQQCNKNNKRTNRLGQHTSDRQSIERAFPPPKVTQGKTWVKQTE